VSDFDKALELDPTDWESYGSRGLSYHNLKLYNKAIEDYNKCIGLNPNYKNAYTNRGLSNYDLGNKSKACEDWKKAASLGSKIAASNIIDFCK
jgi:tetratricopeptide (TPR) repeat protein